MTITIPNPMTATDDTVTFSRADWNAYLDALEDAADAAIFRAEAARRAALGEDEYDRLTYTASEAARLLDGVHPIVIWRDRLGLKQRTLAAAAGVGVSYLAEIEGGKKPGSAAAIKALAAALRVPMEFLVTD